MYIKNCSNEWLICVSITILGRQDNTSARRMKHYMNKKLCILFIIISKSIGQKSDPTVQTFQEAGLTSQFLQIHSAPKGLHLVKSDTGFLRWTSSLMLPLHSWEHLLRHSLNKLVCWKLHCPHQPLVWKDLTLRNLKEMLIEGYFHSDILLTWTPSKNLQHCPTINAHWSQKFHIKTLSLTPKFLGIALLLIPNLKCDLRLDLICISASSNFFWLYNLYLSKKNNI